MSDTSRTTVVIPAFNEESVIGTVIQELRNVADWHDILVVDDGSTDKTLDAAQRAGARTIRHPYNKGNGASVKSGIRAAQGEFVLVFDGDGQHLASDAKRLLSRLSNYELVIGARPATSQATIGRRLGNAFLNRLASYLTSTNIEDLTSGLRAARATHFREFLHLLPNGFSTPTTTTLAFIKSGYSICFEPTEARPRTGTSKIKFLQDGIKFVLIVLRVITLYSPLRIFVPISVGFLCGGIGYAIWTIAFQSHVTNTSVLLTTLGVFVFLFGLISEQISTLRMEPRRKSE